ncbi:MAG: hypothetical protein ACYCSF_06025 [Acidimicrobiales bacterium]
MLSLVADLALRLVDIRFALLFLLVVYGRGLLFTIGALLLDELTSRRYEGLTDRLLLVCWALIEQFGYRQMTVVWQLRGSPLLLAGESASASTVSFPRFSGQVAAMIMPQVRRGVTGFELERPLGPIGATRSGKRLSCTMGLLGLDNMTLQGYLRA